MPILPTGGFMTRGELAAQATTNRNMAKVILERAAPGSRAEAEGRAMIAEAEQLERIINEPC